ncbi:MAG: lipoate--protein ligase family protein [Gemmatimonadaceae bacterium]
MQWHFMVSPPAAGAANMALDEALMRRAARTGDAVFRVYSWSAPTLSLGRNQRARDCYDLERAGEAGVDFVRRPTGGRALLHHREITYSATLPAADAAAARAAYGFINGILIAGLARLGVPARLTAEAQAIPPGLRPCFDVPAEHEIVLGERKLVGSAQWRRGGALLQHGSILVRDDQPLIQQLLAAPQPSGAGSAATLHQALGRDPSVDEMADALRPALRESARHEPRLLPPDAALEADLAALRASYGADAWTWRR